MEITAYRKVCFQEEAIAAAQVRYFLLHLKIPPERCEKPESPEKQQNRHPDAGVLPGMGAIFIQITHHNVLMDTGKGEAAWKSAPD